MSAGTRCEDLGECRACGKLRYATRDRARHAARIVGAKFGTRMRAYECGGFWHLTSYDAAETAFVREAGTGCRLPARCDACGKVPYPSRGAAEADAQEQMKARQPTGKWLAASTCGVFWHVTANRWHDRAYKGARRDVRKAKRAEALERDSRTHPSQRSTKKRAKRPKSTAAKEST